MSPRDHVICSTAASAALYPFMGLGHTLVFWTASILIDVDHYLDFVYHNGLRDLSVAGMFSYHSFLERVWHLPEFLNVEVLHTVEVLLPIYIVSRHYSLSLLEAVFWGMAFHVFLDSVFLWRHGVFFKRSFSIVEYFIRKRSLESRGLRPGYLYLKAAEAVAERNSSSFSAT